ncbi:MAG: glycoside hydrolase family 30 beta sandwich domain-containing protein [Acidobacteriaceae bacterium]
MRSTMVLYVLSSLAVLVGSPLTAQNKNDVAVWLTTPGRTSLFTKQPATLHFRRSTAGAPAIEVKDRQKYQKMEGFGLALTGGSAQLLMRMDTSQRTQLLNELFGTEDGDIGISYLRVSIGSSDMNDHAFTYDDLRAGDTDADLRHFDLGPDKTSVVPALKEILEVSPSIRILGSPWSAPAWMKTNDNLKGGSLKPESYDTYAHYLVKYIETMKANGIAITAITPQNEPLNPKNTPSMVMSAEQEDQFIGQSLGPIFRKGGIATRILVYDHNCDRPDYPLTILADSQAQQYVEGSAFHLYGGKITALTQVHDAYPKKNVYFTEQMVVDRRHDAQLDIASPVRDLIIGAPRNWSRNVLLWNLAADPDFGPHTNDGGCPVCEGAITLDRNSVTRNAAYYTIAHAARFVRPGSVRVASNTSDALPNVAFVTPAGERVLIVSNDSGAPQQFQIRWRGKGVGTSLDAGAVATYVWK